jgi:hypothetical protein
MIFMIKKSWLFFFALVLVGFLDWLTTVFGVAFFGASENNPLLVGLVSSNMMLFSAVKLFAVVAGGLAFYKAVRLSTDFNQGFTKRFLDISFSLTFLALAIVVINNLTVLKF